MTNAPDAAGSGAPADTPEAPESRDRPAGTGTEIGVVDYLCNAFTPDRRAVWEEAIAAAGIQVRIRDRAGESFCAPEEMVARMDALGVAVLLLPTGEIGAQARVHPHEFDHVAARPHEFAALTAAYPGRFAALHVVDPSRGMAAVREARELLARDASTVGLYLHTHSWDRPFDHADLYPWYAMAGDLGVPVVMQAGTSGGLMPSECGRPIGIDRPALYFPGTRFVLSHTGWPWVDEACAMALKFPNVHLGTGAYPPAHWHASVHAFLRGPGRRKVLFGTNFPTVAHAKALAQIDALDLPGPVRDRLLGGTAREVFPRLNAPPFTTAWPPPRRPEDAAGHTVAGGPVSVPDGPVSVPDGPASVPDGPASVPDGTGTGTGPTVGTVYGIPPQPPVAEHTRWFDAGTLRIGVEHRDVDPEALRATYADNPGHLAELQERSPAGGFTDSGVSVHVAGSSDGHEYLRFDVFDGEPHYHYNHRTGPGEEIVNNVVPFDVTAGGDMLVWAFERLRTRLPYMLTKAGGGHLVDRLDPAALAAGLAAAEREATGALAAWRAREAGR